jgi:hypothetical protein
MDNENSNSFLWVDDALEYLDTSNTGEKEIEVNDYCSSNESSDYFEEDDDTDSSSSYIPNGTIPDYLVDYYFIPNSSSSSCREKRMNHLDHISRRNYKDMAGIRGAATTQRRDRYEKKRSASITPKRRRKRSNILKKTKRIIVLN